MSVERNSFFDYSIIRKLDWNHKNHNIYYFICSMINIENIGWVLCINSEFKLCELILNSMYSYFQFLIVFEWHKTVHFHFVLLKIVIDS